MLKKVELRGIPKHVEMLFGKTAPAYSFAETSSSPDVFPFTSVLFTNVTSHLGSRAAWVSPPAICPLSAPLHPDQVPMLFVFQLTHLSEAKCGVQTSAKLFLPDVSSRFCAFAEITVWIVGNYDFSSRGKYARISLYNWSMVKIKAVWGLSVM